MTHFTSTPDDIQSLDASTQSRLDAFLVSFGQGFNAYLERLARTDQIARLQTKSDEELAKMGLTRDQIPHYVFRDMLHM